MSGPHWVLTKLGGKTGQAVVVASNHPDYTKEPFDIQIGQACFEKNWRSRNLVDISPCISGLSCNQPIFGFREGLEEIGLKVD